MMIGDGIKVREYGPKEKMRAFIIEYGQESRLSEMKADEVEKVAEASMKIISVLNRLNQPYNLLIRNCKMTIIPR
jgi:hypothetical protein